jgi:hypothetical protein
LAVPHPQSPPDEPCDLQTPGQTTPIESYTVNGQSASHQRSSSGIGVGQARLVFDPL